MFDSSCSINSLVIPTIFKCYIDNTRINIGDKMYIGFFIHGYNIHNFLFLIFRFIRR